MGGQIINHTNSSTYPIWDNSSLAHLFTNGTSTSPSTVPTSTGSTSPSLHHSSSHTPIGAIVGGVIGGLCVLIGAIILYVCCYRRRHNTNKQIANQEQTQLQPQQQQFKAAHGYEGLPELHGKPIPSELGTETETVHRSELEGPT